MTYSIEVHKHRFAAWAAGRAASVNGCRFRVKAAPNVLEAIGFGPMLSNPDHLPNPQCFDAAHRLWRRKIIAAAIKQELPPFTHGVVAKLINVYLKSRFVCGGYHNHPHIRAFHPPIDSALLAKLDSEDVGGLRPEWRKAKCIRWSKFDSDQYEAVILNIRKAIPDAALWEVEQYWQGYQ
jgi:hypothetical protein